MDNLRRRLITDFNDLVSELNANNSSGEISVYSVDIKNIIDSLGTTISILACCELENEFSALTDDYEIIELTM